MTAAPSRAPWRLLVAVLVAALLVPVTAPAPAAAVDLSCVVPAQPDLSGQLATVQQVRADVGLPPLTVDPALMEQAQRHVAYLRANPDQGHSVDPALPCAYQRVSAGQNLMWGDPASFWRYSAHFAQHLNPSYTAIGVAVDPDNGRGVWEFGGWGGAAPAQSRSWPADGARLTMANHGQEIGDPRGSCPGGIAAWPGPSSYLVHAAPPTAVSLTVAGQPVPVCALSGTRVTLVFTPIGVRASVPYTLSWTDALGSHTSTWTHVGHGTAATPLVLNGDATVADDLAPGQVVVLRLVPGSFAGDPDTLAAPAAAATCDLILSQVASGTTTTTPLGTFGPGDVTITAPTTDGYLRVSGECTAPDFDPWRLAWEVGYVRVPTPPSGTGSGSGSGVADTSRPDRFTALTLSWGRVRVTSADRRALRLRATTTPARERVTVRIDRRSGGRWVPLTRAVTDARGRARIPVVLPTGTSLLRGRLDGYAATSRLRLVLR